LFKRTTTYVLETVDDIEDPGVQYDEPYKVAGDPTGERAEHAAMEASVAENGGFYIARYEAGKEGTSTVVSKKRATVWNNILWGTSMTEVGTNGAVYRARQMYKKSKSVVSTLCYGVQWDAALQFIATKDADYPTKGDEKGHYNASYPILTGSVDAYAVNNIYDMSGNVWEWTMETFTAYDRVYRGCSSDPDGGNGAAYERSYNTTDVAGDYLGFRITLYIK